MKSTLPQLCGFIIGCARRNLILSVPRLSLNVTYFHMSKMFEEELRKQKDDPTLLLPHAKVRGMKDLDRKLFDKVIIVPWVELNENQVGVAGKYLKKYYLKVVGLKPLQPSCIVLDGEEILGHNFEESTSQGFKRRVFLNPCLVSLYTDISEQDQAALAKISVTEKAFHLSKFILTYQNWKPEEILKAVLPEEEPLTSYSIIGHITHVNIHEPLIPYKKVIGQVLLDKLPGCKTVVNKTDIIDNTFRNFKMEVLCGENNLKTVTKENGCSFELDFATVYWNPRLSTEHERIVHKLKSGDVLYDIFAGVGPFAVPAAKRKCHVLANDLNPESYKWLQQNAKLNKVTAFLKAFNKDGKVFIEDDVKRDILEKMKQKEFRGKAMHVTMNLPAMAVEFLPVFNGLFRDEDISDMKNFPIVHVYCFATKGEESRVEALKMVEENLGVKIEENLVEVIMVRNVSPKKEMMRISFKLWRQLLEGCSLQEPQAKRICLQHNDGEEQGKQQQEQAQ